MMTAEEAERRRKSLLRDRRAHQHLADNVDPSKPIDGDPAELRNTLSVAGDSMDAILEEMLKEKDPFFDSLVDQWPQIAPDFQAKPGRSDRQKGKIFLYVKSSVAVFALRPKLPALKKRLLALPGAPRRLSLHLEIHAN